MYFEIKMKVKHYFTSTIAGGFVLSLFHLAHLCVRRRDGTGGQDVSSNFPTFRGSDKGRVGSERRPCAKVKAKAEAGPWGTFVVALMWDLCVCVCL